jgi:hypothetical protein
MGGLKKMSKRTHISKLNRYIQNQIINALKLNGCQDDDIDLIVSTGTLSDVYNIIDCEELSLC